jgi:transposase
LNLLKKIQQEERQLKDNELLMYSDEAGVKLDVDLCKIWAPKGQQPEIVTHSPSGRVNLTGFVCPSNGKIFINQMEKGNSENFIKQLSFISEACKDFIVKLYVDNARWHKTKAVMEYVEKTPNIELRFLPKYAPEINPMERHWWYLRKRKTKNKVFDSKEDCLDSINEHLLEMSKEDVIRICQI